MSNNAIRSVCTEFKPNRTLNWDETQAVVVGLNGIEKPQKGGYTLTAFEYDSGFFVMKTQKSGEIKISQYDSSPILSFEKLIKIANKIIEISESEAKKKEFVVPEYLGIFPIVHKEPFYEEVEHLLLLQNFRNYMKNNLIRNNEIEL